LAGTDDVHAFISAFFLLPFKIYFALFLTFTFFFSSLLDIRASYFLILNFDTLGGLLLMRMQDDVLMIFLMSCQDSWGYWTFTIGSGRLGSLPPLG
jgi:hypothetical protein